MVYTPTAWVDNAAPPISAANLNKMETGIDQAHDALVPAGGTTDQVLAKSSATDYALKWATPAAGGAGGGYIGAWSSSVAYPAGSVVTYGSKTWGCVTAVASGGSPPAGPGAAPTFVPNPVDNVASAPEITIAADGASASSSGVSNAAFTAESGEPAPKPSSSSKSGWLKYTPATSGSVTFTTVGSTDDSLLAMYSKVGTDAVTFGNLTYLTNADDNAGGSDASITYSVVGETTYYFQVGSYSGAVQTYIFNISGARATAPVPGPWTQLAVVDPVAGHTIQDEGTALTARAGLNFVGAGVTAIDDAVNSRTLVTIPSYTGTPIFNYVKHTPNLVTVKSVYTDPVSNLTDGSTATYLRSAPGQQPFWIKFDLGTAKEVARIRIFQNNGIVSSNITIESSTDDSTWTARSHNSPTPVIDGWTVYDIAAPATVRYWRVTDMSSLVWWYVAELEMWGTTTIGTAVPHAIQDEGTLVTPRPALNFVGTGVAVTDDSANDRTLVTIAGSAGTPIYQYTKHTPSAATANSTYAGTSPADAIDGNTATAWRASTSAPLWHRVDLGSSKTVSRVRMHSPAGDIATSVTIESSDNDSTWTSRFSSGTPVVGWTTFDFTAATARYWRITAPNTYWYLNEIEYWGTTLLGNASAHAVQDEGTFVTPRQNLNFIGPAVAVTDDLAGDASKVTISTPNILVLAAADPVPGGTPAGTVIIRTA